MTKQVTQTTMKSDVSNLSQDVQIMLCDDMELDLFDPAIDEALKEGEATFPSGHALFADIPLVDVESLSVAVMEKGTSNSVAVEVSEEESSTTDSLVVMSSDRGVKTTKNISTSSSTTTKRQNTSGSDTDCTKTVSAPPEDTTSGTTKPLPQDLPPRPKRSLSSYNLFFQAQRKELLDALPTNQGKKPRKSHGKMGFALMARTISGKWKAISPESKKHYDDLAALDMARYEREMAMWKEQVKDYPELVKKTYKKKPKSDAKNPNKSSSRCKVARKRSTKRSRTTTKS